MDAAVLVNVEVYRLQDLTTGPMRVSGTVHPDALDTAPPDPADWTPLAESVPGLLLRGELADKAGARVLLRLPDRWNGKLVVAGAAGIRGEHSADLIFSDLVLQKGYAYVSQNKGIGSWRPADRAGPDVVPTYFSGQRGAPGSRTNPWLEIDLLNPRHTLADWGFRLYQAACVASSCARQHYGREVTHCYGVGVSNGGYQVKRAMECYPDTFCGGLDWAGPVWRSGALNLTGELAIGLRHFDAYVDSGMDEHGAAAAAIRSAGFSPDLLARQNDRTVSLWQLHRDAWWELALYLYARKIDPHAFPPDRLPDFRELTHYNALEHADAVSAILREEHNGCSLENSGLLRKPLISLHGTHDALVSLQGNAFAYQTIVDRCGCNDNFRLYQIENGCHNDRFKARLPAIELVQPHVQKAFDLLERWVECDEPPPASRLLRSGDSL